MIKRSDKDNLHAAGASSQALLDAIRNQGDLFFRAEDIALCDRLCDQLLHGGANVALTGTNRAAIDHYGKILARRLRGLQDTRVEVFLPSTSEALIARFNEILAARPMAEAMQDRSNETESPVRILFSPEARSMSAREGRLLARLVSSFPGANTRLVLLHDENEDSDQQQVLELLGKRLLRWPVLPPTDEESALLLDAATAAGLGGDARILLERVRPVRRQRSIDQLDDRADGNTDGNRDVNSEDLSPLDPDSPAGRFRARTGMGARVPLYADAPGSAHDSASMHDDNPDQAPEAESSVSRLLWNGVLAIALVIAALLAAAAVFPRQTQALMALATGLWQSEAPAQARVDAPPEDAEPALRLPPVTPAGITPSEPVPATPATAANANANANGEAATSASPAAPAAPASIETPSTPPAKLTAPAAPVAMAPAATSPAATSPAVTSPAAPATPAGSDVSAALEKIKSLNKNSFFVQHIALDNYEEAQLWRRQYPSLSGALVSAIQVEGGRRIKYVVVSGPFADRAAANDYAKRADIPQDSWIRTVRSLQDAAPPVAARRP